MSRSAIPMLAKHKVKAFHIGYNGVGGLPDVNSTFVWRHEQTGTELLTMIEDNYGKEIDLPATAAPSAAHRGTAAPPLKTTIVRGPGPRRDIALVFLYTIDNSGPPTAAQVSTFWADLRRTHPRARVVASSLDDFAAEVLAGEMGELPVVTEELGDSWLFGGRADALRAPI
jgi:hypothetical protein